MTLRIERYSRGAESVLKLVGELRSAQIAEVKAQMTNSANRVLLDLDELTLVDSGVVRFLNISEQLGIELINCPLYIRAWMKKEWGPETTR